MNIFFPTFILHLIQAIAYMVCISLWRFYPPLLIVLPGLFAWKNIILFLLVRDITRALIPYKYLSREGILRSLCDEVNWMKRKPWLLSLLESTVEVAAMLLLYLSMGVSGVWLVLVITALMPTMVFFFPKGSYQEIGRYRPHLSLEEEKLVRSLLQRDADKYIPMLTLALVEAVSVEIEEEL